MSADPTLRDQLQSTLGTALLIDRELGGGGMSRVFVARDTTFDRDVVVKDLPPDAGSALSSDRFKREIAMAARLQHPHIVPVLSAGTTSDGLPFYTMPFVEGRSLRQRLQREGELPVGETIGIMREVTRALVYAHGHGIVHRGAHVRREESAHDDRAVELPSRGHERIRHREVRTTRPRGR